MLTYGDSDTSPTSISQFERALIDLWDMFEPEELYGDAENASAYFGGPQRPRGSRSHVCSLGINRGGLDVGRNHRRTSRGQAHHGKRDNDAPRSPEGDLQARYPDCPGCTRQWDQPADGCPYCLLQSGLLVRPGQQHRRAVGSAELREVHDGRHYAQADDRFAGYAVLGLIQPYVPEGDLGNLVFRD